MSIARLLSGLLPLLLLSTTPAFAQRPADRDGQALTEVTLVTESDRVRFTTPRAALEWQLEVMDPQGQPIFDTGVVSGKTLDWPLTDGQGQPIESGLYSYTLTIHRGASDARVQHGQLQVERARRAYQISVLGSDSTGGVLLTTTDVAAPPESTQPPSPSESFRRSLGGVTFIQPLISGNGTTSSMTKWIDGPTGVVGDTNVTEVNGAVIIGNGTFRGNVHVFGPVDKDVFAGMGTNLITGPGFNYGYAGETFGRSAGFFNVRPDASAIFPNPSLRFMTANVERMIITRYGTVGIGTSFPDGRLSVRAQSASENAFDVSALNGSSAFVIGYSGNIYANMFGLPATTTHVCRDGGFLTTCGSAAEHVPTISDGTAYPAAGDVVSIVRNLANPYDDPHAPFAVARSSRPCDDGVLGFILDPVSGADGKKLNEHYLPLAIYGYFPVKVTTENGPIRRGDPITSSSKPGHGMKAPAGCRTVGYALEDANADGSIQVFAHLAEHTAPAVVVLRESLDALIRENRALKDRLSLLDSRVTALERLAVPAAASGLK